MDTQVASIEDRIAEHIDADVAGTLPVSATAGGLAFANAGQAMEFSKMMAISAVAVPKYLRGNVGACLAIVIQAIEWRLSPYAVANKSYSVNDRLAYESQLIQAVILQRAPIKGRFKVEFTGEGENRVCRIWAVLSENDEIVEYTSPAFGRITPKNSPLWKSDPDQQQFYYSGRALCRRHFPDVLLGVYARDEIEEEYDSERTRDITPPAPRTISSRLDALAGERSPQPDEAASQTIDGQAETDLDTAATNPSTATHTPAPPSSQVAPKKGGGKARPDDTAAEPKEGAASAGTGGAEAAPDHVADQPESLSASDVEAARRYTQVLGGATSPLGLNERSQKYMNQNGFQAAGGPKARLMEKIFSAHDDRVRGKTAPADCDATILGLLRDL